MSDRRLRQWVVLVTCAVFGPYVIGGFRTEQLATYGSAALAFPMMWRLRSTRTFVPVVVIWSALVGVAIIGAVWTPPTQYPPGSFVAGLDNLLTPIVALFTTALWATTDRQRQLALDWLAGTVGILVTLNTTLTLFTLNGAFGWQRNFWAAAGDGTTVAEMASGQGRVSGIFNQPAECGMMCALALVLALWRWRWRTNNPRMLALVSAAAIVGGLLAVSKVIILAGVPVFGVLLWQDHRGRVKRIVRAAGGAVGALVLLSSGVIGWSGETELWSWLSFGRSSDYDRLTVLTGGRYGAGSTLEGVSTVVLRESPVFGYGAQGVTKPLDALWLEALVVAGIFGVVLVLAMIGLLIYRCVQLDRRYEKRVAGGILAIACLASFGVPVFTLNRAGTILWLALGLSLVHVRQPAPVAAPPALRSLQRVGS